MIKTPECAGKGVFPLKINILKMCKVCENNKYVLTIIFVENKMLVHEQFGSEQNIFYHNMGKR